jgi:prophage tail gpP-like protein
MADVHDTVELRVDGKTSSGWTDVQIVASMERAQRTARFTLSDQPVDGVPARFSFSVGSPCEVFVRDQTGGGRRDKIVTGAAEGLEGDSSADRNQFRLPVYSKTVDVILSAPAAGPTFKNLTRIEIVRALCAPHGVGVVLGPGVEAGERLSTFATQRGEKAYNAIDRLMKGQGLVVTDNADGDLVLTRVGNKRAEVAIIRGANILSSSFTIDSTLRYSSYRCRGQRAGDDVDFGSVVAAVDQSSADDWQGRVRILDVQPGRSVDPATAKAMCDWEAAQRAGRSAQATYTVQGWRQRPGGDLWEPNMIVQVRDPFAGIDGEMLIVEVSHSKNESEATTDLLVAPPVAYQQFLPPPPTKRRPSRTKRTGLISDIANYINELLGRTR